MIKYLIMGLLIGFSNQNVYAADSDIQNLLKGVEEKAVEIQVLKEALIGDDANVRHVLFNRITKLNRPDLVDLAINAALDSNDRVLRSMALWQIIMRRSEIVFSFGPQEKYEDQTKWEKHSNEWGGLSALEIKSKFPEKRCANTYPSNHAECRSNNSLTVTGEVLSFRHDSVKGTLKMNEDGTAMVGTADYQDEKAHIYWPLR